MSTSQCLAYGIPTPDSRAPVMGDPGTMSYASDPPDELLASWVPAAATGRALDLGAGEGEASLWLARQGFTVEAVESDPSAYRVLAARLAGTNSRALFADIRHHPLARNTYSLVSALAFLHFFHPDDLGLLGRRLTRALAPGGLLLATVFTTDDPSLEARLESGEREAAPATYRLGGERGWIHYFAPGELAGLFPGLQILEVEEARRLDPTAPESFRAGASLVAAKP